ncbi:TetR/AcrR family transcriptional regulator [Mycobacterium sp. TNTM28]|uniref:TetR/AcrR family transcriptional regulator n=1 Tax=[Mycobacterium] fortunisiensis TaxID=2600579 RepID=A0ABS6KPB4_9MYCO|nr:TetR/AcrR family transcriptional regulator [[Mycobacterium] fortunisiensis]MBU9765350.1 TetR/AcrR family transcriptional regulator [[Mycobacterium] fortunisiensis]
MVGEGDTTATTTDDAEWIPGTRRRVLDTAVSLFGRYSVAGTSLQMIADELGLTKAAIYYHFRTRDQLLLALMEPIFTEIAGVVAVAEQQPDAASRADAMLTGYADIVTRHRTLAAVTTFDPSVRSVLVSHPQWSGVIDRQMALLADIEPEPSDGVTASVALTGVAGGASTASHRIDDETLRAQLIAAGRRILGLPHPSSRS